ncbi:MAG TPA: hypothetical protein VLV15_13755, partial [Dongiaceae bacterium]|nr:hypothetical protein [Dongiaceae bacterium]
MKASLFSILVAGAALAQETPAIPSAEPPAPVQVAQAPAAEAPVAVEKQSAPEAPAPEANYQRYDHRGALGLLLATTVERKDTGGAGALSDTGWRAGLEVGGTYPVSYSGNEFKLSYRALLGGPVVDSALYLGFRGYFDLSFWKSGLDQWKTFFDLDVCAHVTPAWSVTNTDGLASPLSAPGKLSAGVTVTGGPRVAVGVQLDFLPVSGAYLAIAGQLGFGTGVRFGAEALF